MPRNCYGLRDKNRGPENPITTSTFLEREALQKLSFTIRPIIFLTLLKKRMHENLRNNPDESFKKFRFELNPFAAIICYKILITLLEFYRFIIRPEFSHTNI